MIPITLLIKLIILITAISLSVNSFVVKTRTDKLYHNQNRKSDDAGNIKSFTTTEHVSRRNEPVESIQGSTTPEGTSRRVLPLLPLAGLIPMITGAIPMIMGLLTPLLGLLGTAGGLLTSLIGGGGGS